MTRNEYIIHRTRFMYSRDWATAAAVAEYKHVCRGNRTKSLSDWAALKLTENINKLLEESRGHVPPSLMAGDASGFPRYGIPCITSAITPSGRRLAEVLSLSAGFSTAADRRPGTMCKSAPLSNYIRISASFVRRLDHIYIRSISRPRTAHPTPDRRPDGTGFGRRRFGPVVW